MNKSTKSKIIMYISMIFFMAFYAMVFGTKNASIGLTIVLIAFMNLGNDLSSKPKKSFIKVLCVLLVLGISSYLNNPLTIWGCILTFIVVFATTFTSYNLFGSMVYLPYLMCYFMMIGNPITLDLLPMRILSLTFGTIFIVGLNILVNKKKDYKLSKATIDSLVNELNVGIDLRLEGKPVSADNFKEVNGFYKSVYGKFEYKYFPTKAHQAALNVIKAFQYIGMGVVNFDFTDDELKYTKETLSKIRQINPDEIFEGIEIKTKQMYVVLLNLEIIANESKRNFTEDIIHFDNKNGFSLMKIMLKREFGFKSPKFTFAFKMAVILFVWQLLTLIFNLPFTKWLYFITLPLMMPYINDLKYTAKARIKGTFVGVFLITILMIIMPYVPISVKNFVIITVLVCLFVIIFKIKDKFILTVSSTVISVMFALMYIELPHAIELKLLWVVIGVVVVSLFNFLFLPYSVEIETKNNLKCCCKLNQKLIELIKDKCKGGGSDEKTTILVVSNVIRENIEVTDENRQLYKLQIKINDICNFILTYLDIYPPSGNLGENLIAIIDKDIDINDNLDIKDRTIAYSLSHVLNLHDDEKALTRDLK